MIKKMFLMVLLVMFAFTGIVFAESSKEEAMLKEMFPQLKFESFKPAEVTGLYEVVAGDQIFYFSPDGYLIFGEIWSKDGKSITADKREKLMSAKIKDLPLDKAIKIGNGKNIVIEFSDPDCPFCRKASEFFAKRTDVTRYVFLFPLTQLHPEAEKKSKYILCSDEQHKAYEEVMTGKLDKANFSLMPHCDESASPVLKEHIAIGKKLGIRGTPMFFVNGNSINGANVQAIEKLLTN
jgi:thiol:disulfide interchange protein DsbC